MAENKEKKVSIHIPLEITTEILLKLPTKSLLRFKSVCKTWYALIKNPNFIRRHEEETNSISMLFIGPKKRYNSNGGFCKPKYLFNPNNPFNPNNRFNRSPYSFLILGICNGLVCVGLLETNIIIIGNPTTREQKQIPSYNLVETKRKDLVFYGFSSISNEIKLVRVIYPISKSEAVSAEMYAMSINLWEEIDVKTADSVVRCNQHYDAMPVVLNDVFYWAACNYNRAHVVSLDVTNKCIDGISIPIEVVNVFKSYWRIKEFKGEISVIVSSEDSKFDLWVLNENKSSWVWKLKINSIPAVEGHFGNLGRRMGIVKFGTDSKLDFHYLSSKDMDFGPCVDVSNAVNEVYAYTETLRSINP